MKTLPIYIDIFFVATVMLAVYLFWKASGNSKKVLLASGIWLFIQAQLGLTGFYQVTDTTPPRFLLMIMPAAVIIVLLFVTSKGRQFLDTLDIKILTLLSVVRIPVEIVLFMLLINNAVPGIMTFGGKNFDIFSGITAPLIYYYGFVKQRIGNKFILAWNFICLALVFNVMVHGILSAPSVFQKLSFDQPNIAILYFPFVWLPAVVVPVVILSHLVSIRRLLKETKKREITRPVLQPLH